MALGSCSYSQWAYSFVIVYTSDLGLDYRGLAEVPIVPEGMQVFWVLPRVGDLGQQVIAQVEVK